jgi:hypothetical protein
MLPNDKNHEWCPANAGFINNASNVAIKTIVGYIKENKKPQRHINTRLRSMKVHVYIVVC